MTFQLTKKSGKSSRKWVWLFAVIVMVVTSIPYMVGFASQGESWRFTGFVFGVEDGNSYIAKMLRGSAGEWLFRSPYTAVRQKGVIAFLPYLLLGKLAVLPIKDHVQLVILFHMFRFLAGIAMIFATYDFLSIYIRKEAWRRWALAIITLGGGLGWVLILFGKVKWLGSLPLDLTSPESFGFLAIYGLPHLALARAFLLWGLRAFLIGYKIYIPGLCLLALGLFQPLDILIAWIVMGVYILLTSMEAMLSGDSLKLVDWFSLQRNACRFITTLFISSPMVIYTFIRFRVDEYLRAWTAQNQIISPHPAHYLLAYGLMGVFVVLGVNQIRKEFPDFGWLLIGWVGVLPILVYFPTVIQRRLAEGVWAAIVILAVKPFTSPDKPLSFRWTYSWIFAFPTTLLLIVGGIQTAYHPGPPVFRPLEEVESYMELKQNARIDAVVLSSHVTGNPLPAWAPVHVVFGHGPETANYERVSEAVKTFYDEETSQGERVSLIAEYHVDYVYWGPAEQQLGEWDPELAPYLSVWYEKDPYIIYQVNQGVIE